jgi:hypothetical protein
MSETCSKMCTGLHAKYPLFLSDFNVNVNKFKVNVLDSFSKNTQILNFMTIGSLGAELFYEERRTDGRTDRNDEVNSRNFAILRMRQKN